MKKFTKRAMSLLLVLALVVSMFAAMALSVSAASYTYNSGKRGTVCTSLSSKAKSYYSGSYTYASLSAKSGSSLRTSLRALVNQKNNTVGYGGLRTYMKYTDAYQGSSSKLMLFYSGGTTTSTWDSGKTWNREHMWPQSLGGNAVEADLNAMRPADPTANSSRNNNKYGEVGSGYTTFKTSSKNGSLVCGYYKDGIFEPLDNVKGDCARVVLYDYVMASSMSSVTVVFDSVSTLLNWCKSDPVDTYEMSRNDSVQSIQGSRNPFIDYPELGWKLLGYSVPSGMTTPSNGVGSSSGGSSSGSSSSGSGSSSSGSSSGSSSSGSSSSSSSSSGSTVSVSAGEYVIAAKVGSTYYAMSNSFASKITGKTISVSNGKVSASNASGYTVTLAKSGNYYTISNGSSYLKYSSSTNFASSSTAYKWALSKGTNGSYRLVAGGNSARGLVFSKSAGKFGAYALTNVKEGSTTYYDIELLPVTGSSSSGGSSSGSGSSSSGSSSSSTSSNTYKLVTSSADLTAGQYIILVAANGSYAGNYSYYALTTSKDGSYAAMSAQGLNFSSLPTSLTCDASSASTFVWTMSGSRTSFTLKASGGYLVSASGSTKLTLSSSSTTWSGTYSSSYQAFRVKGNSRYISLRDDISTTGSNGNPLFCTTSSTSTGETYLYFYKLS